MMCKKRLACLMFPSVLPTYFSLMALFNSQTFGMSLFFENHVCSKHQLFSTVIIYF